MAKTLSHKTDLFIGAALALVAFGVYLRTLAPTVDFIDSGELATVAATLGIAHPTGYPLFTLIGHVFAHLPLGMPAIQRLNLMSAVFCATALFVFYHLFLLIQSERFRSAFRTTKPTGKPPKTESTATANRRLAAGAGAFVLAFSETYWSQALSIEVYSLHILLLSLTMLFFMKAIVERMEAGPSDEARASWYVFALMLGLGFTNHMTTILLAPGFLYLYYVTHGSSQESWNKIARGAIPFLIGLSVYLYLPLRAAQEPLLSWGDPATLEKFWWHFSGKQYRVWIFSSFESASKQFQYFIDTYPKEFASLPLMLSLVGLGHLYRSMKKVFWFTIALFLGCVLYSVNYDIHDIDSYFLLAYVVTAMWATFGVEPFFRFMEKRKQTKLGYALCAFLAVFPLYFNYATVDESENYAVEDYTMNMFASLDSNAVVLSFQWDYFVSASYYFQHVEGVRPDVVVLDKELFRRSWYFKQLERQYPWLMENSRREVDAFLGELHKFEHDIPYNPATIQGRFEEMIRSFLQRSLDTRPVYVTPEVEPEFVRGFHKLPSGLAIRLLRDTTEQSIKPHEFSFRSFSKTNNKYVDGMRGLYATSYTNQGVHLAMTGRREEGIDFLKKALQLKPDARDARMWLERFGAM
jgi:hypothetical protein